MLTGLSGPQPGKDALVVRILLSSKHCSKEIPGLGIIMSSPTVFLSSSKSARDAYDFKESVKY